MPGTVDKGTLDEDARRRVVRLAGWLVAANALLVLGAAALPAPIRDAAGQFVAWCRLG